jgi:hypothetical protein
MRTIGGTPPELLGLQPPFYCNVMQFGAKGDNKTDDSDAFLAAFNAIQSGATILIPGGRRYVISKALAWRGKSIRVKGYGACLLFPTAGTVLTIGGNDDAQADRCTVEGLELGGSGTGVGLRLVNSTMSRLIGCRITGFGTGALVEATAKGYSYNACIESLDAPYNMVGLELGAGSTNAVVMGGNFGNQDAKATCIRISGGGYAKLIGPMCQTPGWVLDCNATYCQLFHPYCESMPKARIHFGPASAYCRVYVALGGQPWDVPDEGVNNTGWSE